MTLVFESPMPASQEKLWEFHKSAEALVMLTPPPAKIKVIGEALVQEGALHVIESSVFGLGKSRWEARISAVGADGFTDVAEKSPFKSWRHVHRFLPAGPSASVLRDEVTFEHPLAPVLSLGVRGLFWWRHRQTRRALRGILPNGQVA